MEHSSVPTVYCLCGCGRITETYKDSRPKRGYVAGQHKDYIKGHCPNAGRYVSPALVDFIQQDMGYETPCWIWQRARSHGYGVLTVNGKTAYAHRCYFEKRHGCIPNGMFLDHLCVSRTHGTAGSTLCCNPAHLEVVTHIENVRRGKGSKLSFEAAVRIREMYATGQYSQRQLGTLFGVHNSHISRVVSGAYWP